MKKLLLCSIALLALASVIACKTAEKSEDKKLNENIQGEKDADSDTSDNDGKDENTDDVKGADEINDSDGIPDTDSNDDEAENGEQKGHPPNSYKDIDYDVKSIHD